MNIPRSEAVRLIEERIKQFQRILRDANCNNIDIDEYGSTRDETIILISDLFSEAEAYKFKGPETIRFVPISPEEELEEYRKEIKEKLAKSEDLKERIQNFWFNGEIGGDKRLVERAHLLMRFYDTQSIFDIGKKMNLPYFTSSKDHREMSYHRCALEISQAIKDEDLLELVKRNPPRYELSLGGFRGEYYTATKQGELMLGNSWGDVRKNTQQSLENWGMRVYGVLQAIITKGGTAKDMDIRDEVEKILDPGYSWEDLLPRLAQRKLIFKDYSYWEMPPEIIPAVQEELSVYRKTREIIPKIVSKRSQINLIFEGRFNTKLFKESEQAIIDMGMQCKNEDDFNNRIQALSTLIERIETNELKQRMGCMKKGSVNIIEEILEKEVPNYDRMIVVILRNIIKLRSKKFPIHSNDPEFIKALSYFGFTYPPNFKRLWEKVLSEYYRSLELLFGCLSTI
jgi:hypothetical protein